MRHRFVKVAAITLTVSAVSMSNILPNNNQSYVYAASQNEISSQVVNIGGKSTAFISDAHMLMQDQGNVLSFSVTYSNKNEREMNLIDYWMRVKNKNGKVFSVKISEQDKNKTYVASDTSVTITYYALVDKQTKINDFIFDVIKWDFDAVNYERTLGSIKYPAKGTDKVPATSSKNMIYDGTNVKASVKQAIVHKDQNNSYFTINLVLDNTGNKPVNLGKMKFFIQTENQLIYNVEAEDLSNVSLQPREKRIITLQSMVPIASTAKSFTLAVVTAEETSSIKIPIGLFTLPISNQMPSITFGKVNPLYLNGQIINTLVKEAQIYQDKGKKYVFVDFDVHNTGSENVKFPDLKFYIKDKSGKQYLMNFENESAELQIGEKKSLQLSAEITGDFDMNKSELVAQLKNSKNAYIPFGVYQLPKQATMTATPIGKNKELIINNSKVDTKVNESFVNKVENNSYLYTDFTFQNNSQETINLKDVSFTLQTKNGTSYPLTYSGEGIELLPGINNNVQLTGMLPNDLVLKDSELIIRIKQDNNKGFIVASYKLDEKNKQGSIGGNFTYGDYEVAVTSVERTYLEKSDMLVADILITNNSNGSKKIPSISGYFLVNGVKIQPKNMGTLQLDDVDILTSKASTNFVVYADIPYSTDIKQISFVVTEKSDSKDEKVLHQFSDTKTSTIIKREKNYTYSIENIGMKSEISIGKTAVYGDGKNDFFYAEIILTNKERRAVNLTDLGGYIQADGKAVIPIDINTFSEQVFPDGRVLLSAMARIPRNYYKEELDLYVGQRIHEKDDTSNNALIKSVAYKLKKEDIVQKQNELTEINYLNYDFSINNSFASFHVRDKSTSDFDFDGIELSLHYDLIENGAYENDFEKHKLIIELVDADKPYVRYSKVLSIDEFKVDTEFLESGEGKIKKIIFKDENAIFEVTHHKYMLNIYHEYDGNKFLLASKENVW
ncbi:hypothetical protein [Paenibacillus sp. IITD108]|uniref:hypothetical protein n=1 Tax=Paenibacillus sp. IITD108 TaxID=3116649 RepID=UPI002F40072F